MFIPSNFIKAFAMTILIGLWSIGNAHAGEQGTAAEAEAMVRKAVAFIKANGRDKAAQEFMAGGSFKDRDLYISYYDMSGKVIAHGANPKLVGKEMLGVKDADGKLIVQMIIELAKTKGKGWTESYKWLNPLTGKIADKVSYVERVDDAWIAVGIYK